MSLVLPREEAVENIFSRILSSDEACERLLETFYDHCVMTINLSTPTPIILQRLCLMPIKW